MYRNTACVASPLFWPEVVPVGEVKEGYNRKPHDDMFDVKLMGFSFDVGKVTNEQSALLVCLM